MRSAERHLRQLAAVAGYASLMQLARAAGIDKNTIYFPLRRGRRPHGRTIEKIALALGITTDIVARVLGAT
jgi:DNA-binding phage protein